MSENNASQADERAAIMALLVYSEEVVFADDVAILDYPHIERLRAACKEARAALASTPSPLQVDTTRQCAFCGSFVQPGDRCHTCFEIMPLHATAEAPASPQVAQPAVRVPLTTKEFFDAVKLIPAGPDRSWREAKAVQQACAKKWGVPLSSEKGDGQ